MFLLVGTVLVLVFCLYLARHNNLATPMTCAVLFGGMMQDAAIAPPGEDPKSWAYTATGEEIEAFFFGRALEKMKDDEATMVKNTFDEFATASVAWKARKRTEAAHGALQRRMVKKNPLVPIFTSAVHGLNGN